MSQCPSEPERLAKTEEILSAENFQVCLFVLEALTQDPAFLVNVSPEDRIRLMKAAGRISHPTLEDNRRISRTSRKLRREKRIHHDRELRKNTGIREARQVPVFQEPKALPSVLIQPAGQFIEPKMCYVCKARFTQVHFFYDGMCPECADFNYQKRFQTAPLEGRTALVTGGRVKIGYQSALKLLRAGARTLVSTRFPQDAALRFSREEDFSAWKHRLQIHGLDLRHSPSVEIFCQYLLNTEQRLDFLINNAAQTVRKPPGFYRHLMEWESKFVNDLPEALRPLLAAHENFKHALETAHLSPPEKNIEPAIFKSWPSNPPLNLRTDPPRSLAESPAVGISASAKLSMIPYDFDKSDSCLEIFPEGKLDQDLQQVDLRPVNSWRLALADVSTPEMLEVHLVNAVAPFILAAKLKPLMLKDPKGERHIVNASAMEGKFSRLTKTDKHPHTNMAKAALNMLTLTSAQDYAKDGIYMNAVDTGWITDEDPADLSQAKKEMHDFEPPLDIVDGAARLLDPVFSGILTGDHVWGKFLKDYKPTAW